MKPCNSRRPLKAGAQTERILAHLAAGRAITPLQALEKYNCWRLSGRILDLRRRGHSIVTTKVTRGGKTFASYTLRGRH